MNRLTAAFLVALSLHSCEKEKVRETDSCIDQKNLITAADLSSYPEINATNPLFYSADGNQEAFLNILKNSGINTIRLRLWVNPSDQHSGFQEVKDFAQSLKNQGFKTWLSLHYSNTWADPSQQTTPSQWQGLGFNQLKDSVYQYTTTVMNEIQPEYVQIGNEINSGFLHPYGHISTNYFQFLSLMNEGIMAVRDVSPQTKIIMHHAGFQDADWFYNQITSLDYDIIGLSYYPIWHGKSLNDLQNEMQHLSAFYDKDIVIAETAYPFTLDWNDWTNNIVGLDEQLILPDYPATPAGQRDFMNAIKQITLDVNRGIGFCYWGGELIAWDGPQSPNGSPWENQAFFDFNNHSLPVLHEFNHN